MAAWVFDSDCMPRRPLVAAPERIFAMEGTVVEIHHKRQLGLCVMVRVDRYDVPPHFLVDDLRLEFPWRSKRKPRLDERVRFTIDEVR